MFKKCLSFLDVAKEFLIKYLTEDILKSIDLKTLLFYQSNDELLEIIYFAKSNKNTAKNIYILIQYLPQLDSYSSVRACLSVERIMAEHVFKNKNIYYPEIYVLGFYNGDENDPERRNFIEINEDVIDNSAFAREILFGTHLVN